jgi:hypothetical protein
MLMGSTGLGTGLGRRVQENWPIRAMGQEGEMKPSPGQKKQKTGLFSATRKPVKEEVTCMFVLTENALPFLQGVNKRIYDLLMKNQSSLFMLLGLDLDSIAFVITLSCDALSSKFFSGILLDSSA